MVILHLTFFSFLLEGIIISTTVIIHPYPSLQPPSATYTSPEPPKPNPTAHTLPPKLKNTPSAKPNLHFSKPQQCSIIIPSHPKNDTVSQTPKRHHLDIIISVREDVSEEMLHGLILSAVQSHPNMAFAKAFVAKLLREFSCRVSARRVLEDSFRGSLKVVKESLEEYSSPDFRGGDHNETEAIQRLNLHTAMTNGRHLLWLIERMIELRVGDVAVKEWSEQGAFTADLQRAFRDEIYDSF